MKKYRSLRGIFSSFDFRKSVIIYGGGGSKKIDEWQRDNPKLNRAYTVIPLRAGKSVERKMREVCALGKKQDLGYLDCDTTL